MQEIFDYLEENWDKCLRENRFDEDTLIGLPYPYTVPSTEYFNEIYYWDTYFTNVGLLKFNKPLYAKHNVDDMLYLVDKYGFMPNGNRTYYLNRSQPPFLSEMVKDVYEYYKDRVWLLGAYETLKKEHNFWQTMRATGMGLNRHDTDRPDEELVNYVEGFVNRTGVKPEGMSDILIGRHALAESESGWDMNPRLDFDAYNFAPVDLNCLLYQLERNMAYFATILEKADEVAEWENYAKKRLEIMNKFMLNKENLFFDYNFKTGKNSEVFSVASLFPLYVKAATEEQAEAAVKNLCRLEENYGVATCEKGSGKGISYQWDYPNGWSCLEYVTVVGLLNYGYTEDAKRIAQKFVNLVEKAFKETGHLWEKYNVVEGNINVSNEYKMPTMLGWSAGVYVVLKDLLENI